VRLARDGCYLVDKSYRFQAVSYYIIFFFSSMASFREAITTISKIHLLLDIGIKAQRRHAGKFPSIN
jgi:hypothetical protein